MNLENWKNSLPECIICGFPVYSPSMGGDSICGWCDCGRPLMRPEIQKARELAWIGKEK